MSVAVAQAESPDSANVALFQADRALSRCRLGSEALLEESPDLRSMMGAGQRPAVRPAILSRLRDPGLEPVAEDVWMRPHKVRDYAGGASGGNPAGSAAYVPSTRSSVVSGRSSASVAWKGSLAAWPRASR